MTTASIIITILFILCLTSVVAPRSIGLVKADDKPSQKIWIPVIFGFSQGIMAVAGHSLGRLTAHLYTYIAEYMVFVMMLVVAVKLFVDSMRVLKGKMMYTLNSEKDIILLSILAAFNTFLYSLMSVFYAPFGIWFFVAVTVAGFLWAFFTVRVEFKPELMKKLSFIEFSAAVFTVVIAFLYLFTDLMI
jgi:putative Mn2+ efflux pump MntP